MSSKLRIIFTDFIESIPDEKLLGFSDTAGKVHTTRDYYLQNLGLTTNLPKCNILRVMVSNTISVTSAAQARGSIVASAFVPVDNPLTPAEIKKALIASF
ncbi:uncharacterized protein N7506_007328 [Penicillium brevicompactum]|uniref:uncharacterized protein n=1 Tax=Penicillium brevicompactum TaxID=5074 RepID=UPI002540A4CE|nr:uncharacterized protein N7506_007328 [Penicillium brevicompactum]KAJ5333545.1 hypothetical protein N7506_007328 [Penicillium brevicompactum]